MLEVISRSTADNRSWLAPVRPQQAGELPLVCFSYAGGSPSAFRGWPAALAGVHVLPVLLPGRCTRLAEPPLTESEPIVTAVADALEAAGHTGRYALFGHSMGALLAYRTACELRRRGAPAPVRLFVSASRPPHRYGDQARHRLSDPELRHLVRGLGGMTADGALADSYLDRRLPVLRADLAVCDSYRWQPEPPLDCPMTAFAGTEDPVARRAEMTGWRGYTARSFLTRTIAGDHFFLLAGHSRQQLLHQLGQELTALTTTPAKHAGVSESNGMTA